jgi:hypothetical protein
MNLNPIKRDTTIVETFGMEDLKVSHLFINFDYLKFKQFFFFFSFLGKFIRNKLQATT